jgi:hypothetical protein
LKTASANLNHRAFIAEPRLRQAEPELRHSFEPMVTEPPSGLTTRGQRSARARVGAE